jgi:carboxylesterase
VDALNLYGSSRHRSFVLGRSKKRALLVHGFPGTPAELLTLAEFLVTQGFEVHGPLLPGFGTEIAALGKTRWQAWVAAAQHAWETLQEGAEVAVLVGFSMGGAVAVNVAANVAAQTRPDQLVLIAPFWRLADPRARFLPVARYVLPELKPFGSADFSTAVVRAQFARLEPTLDLDDPVVQRTLREEVVLPTSSLVEVQRLGGSAYRAAPGVTSPTLLLQGRDDTTVYPADTRRLALRLGGPVTLIELPAGHQLIEPRGAGHRELLRRLEQHLRVDPVQPKGDLNHTLLPLERHPLVDLEYIVRGVSARDQHHVAYGKPQRLPPRLQLAHKTPELSRPLHLSDAQVRGKAALKRACVGELRQRSQKRRVKRHQSGLGFGLEPHRVAFTRVPERPERGERQLEGPLAPADLREFG